MLNRLDLFDDKIINKSDYDEINKYHAEQSKAVNITKLAQAIEKVYSKKNHYDLKCLCFDLFGDCEVRTFEYIASYLLDTPQKHISDLDRVITHENYLLFDVSDETSTGGFTDFIVDGYREDVTTFPLKSTGHSNIQRKYEFIDIAEGTIQTVEPQTTYWKLIREYLVKSFEGYKNIEPIDLKVLKYKYLVHTSNSEPQVKGIRAIQLGTDNLDDIIDSDSYSNYRCNWKKGDTINIYNTYTKENTIIPILDDDNYFMRAELKRNIKRLQMRFGDIDINGKVKRVNTVNYVTNYK